MPRDGHLKRFVLVSLLILGGAFALAITAFFRLDKNHEATLGTPGQFTYVDGKPYVVALINGKSVLSLFDTGSTYNILPPQLINSEHTGVSPTHAVRTVLGTKSFRTAEADVILANHTLSGGKNLVGNVENPVIGAGLIFSSKRIYISREGFTFEPSINLNKASYCDNGVVLDLSGQTLDSPIGRIYLSLPVNGVRELVMFDTGNAALITGTNRDNEVGWRFPNGILFVSDANGGLGLRRYINRDAAISIGGSILKLSYKSFPGYVEPRVRFVLGAEFLNYYSLYVEPHIGKVCYFARGLAGAMQRSHQVVAPGQPLGS